ncbi:MAG TPA: Hsp70 family protein, partial [Pirellulales bacterium]|nr:Hsp70 family protein [Pirellulales bacterium]
MTAKFAIGIDLGTTNSALAYCALDLEQPSVELMSVPQLVASGTIEERPLLPSFLYLGTDADAKAKNFDLPWEKKRDFAVGELARRQSAEVPTRSVAAAKSWLCHSRVDRHQPILPWNAPADVAKISPVTASARYLAHLAAAWQAAFKDAPLAQQHVVLTVPASFDPAARELTREAALAAGLPESLVLLEEPQAAVYAWLADQGDRWRKQMTVGDRLLVCDVGGGTTDFTLVGVGHESGDLVLQRMAVGNHILVGGDNMDLALAHFVAAAFNQKGVQLDPWQSVALWHSCRNAKETLLAIDGPKKHPVAVLGRGSKLIKGTVSVEVERDAVATLLLDGFFPQCQLGDEPARQRASGFRELGLPFESDTAITRHLAAFLRSQGEEGQAVRPTHILFNGGVFKSSLLRERMCNVLASWFAGQPPRGMAGNQDLDFAVARGAAYYGFAKQRKAVRIRGGTARSYYVGIETAGLAIPGAPR